MYVCLGIGGSASRDAHPTKEASHPAHSRRARDALQAAGGGLVGTVPSRVGSRMSDSSFTLNPSSPLRIFSPPCAPMHVSFIGLPSRICSRASRSVRPRHSAPSRDIYTTVQLFARPYFVSGLYLIRDAAERSWSTPFGQASSTLYLLSLVQ